RLALIRPFRQEGKLLFLAHYANNWQDGGRRHEMTTRDTLIFRGRRWPGVQPLGGATIERFYQFAFRASGDGQQWDTDRPMAFWRNFAAIDLTHRKEVLAFIKRHGDPFGDLDREPARPNQSPDGTNAKWPALKRALREIAQAWEPLDP